MQSRLAHKIVPPLNAVREGEERFAIQTRLMHELFNPLLEHFADQLQVLAAKNRVLNRNEHTHFTFRGVLYPPDDTNDTSSVQALRLRARQRRAPGARLDAAVASSSLHVSLRDDMTQLLRQMHQAETQFDQSRAYMSQALSICNNINDMQRVLPSFMHAWVLAHVQLHPDRYTVQPHTVTESQVRSLNEHHAAGLDAVNVRRTMNLLL